MSGSHDHAAGEFRILHLSDIHATEHGDLHAVIDGAERLVIAAEHAAEAGLGPHAVVITGDLVERGHAAAYPRVAAAMERASVLLEAPVLTVLGNHDLPDAALALPGHEGGHDRIVIVGAIRFVLLDSSTRRLGAKRLAWLHAQLGRSHGEGTVVALHHPPTPSPLQALQGQELQDAEELFAVLAGSDVRAVLAGHFHHQLTAVRYGIPIFVGPSLAYHQLMAPAPGTLAGIDVPMMSLIRMTGAGVAQHGAALFPPEPLFTIRSDQTSPTAQNRK